MNVIPSGKKFPRVHEKVIGAVNFVTNGGCEELREADQMGR
jgi:hypothetical protein